MADLTILLVDDENEYIDALSQRLGFRGVSAHTAYSGSEALDVLQNETVDAVVLDLRMPGMDGLELLKRIREAGMNMPAAIMTGHGGAQDRQVGEALGAGAYLNKPTSMEELLQVLESLTGKTVTTS